MKNISPGADVKIERAGDVIPKLVDVIKSDSVGLPVSHCPCCDAPTEQRGVDLFCTNSECPDRIIENIVFMAKIIGVEELGRPTAEKLNNINDIFDITDFNYISYEDILSLEGYGEKSAKTLFDNIQNSLQNINEIKFLASFGIDGIGRTMTDKLLTVAGDLPSLFQMDKEALMAIDGVGEKLADNLKTSMEREEIIDAYGMYCKNITVPNYEHVKPEKQLHILVDTPKGQFKFPACLVAEQRADYYSCHVDGNEKGSEEWQEEVDFAMKDTSEIKDWLWNSTDWEDWEPHASKVGNCRVSDEDGWWSNSHIEFVEGEAAEECKPKTICFTGTMPEGRKFYEGIAVERGLKPSKSVTKDLDILVISEAGWTSGKVKKAEKYGTEIVPLEDWL